MKFFLKLPSLFLISLIFFAFNSCKKEDMSFALQNKSVRKFLSLPPKNDPILKRITTELERQQKLNPEFIPSIIERNGFPLWDKNQIIKKSSYANIVASNEDTIVYIPLAVQGEDKVSAFFLATINGYINLELYNKFDYEQFGFDTTGTSNANKLAVQFMVLDFVAFGHKDFKLYDDRLLKDFEIAPGTLIKDRSIHIDYAVGPPGERSGWTTWDYFICKTTRYLDCSYNTTCCTRAGVPPGACSACEGCWKSKIVCEKVSVLVFYDDGYEPPTGGSGGGGGGNTNTNTNTNTGTIQPCNPLPLIQNGLPPCPKGSSLGWEPIFNEDNVFVFSYSNLDNPIFVNDDSVEMPAGYQFTFSNFDTNTITPIRILGKTDPRGNTEDMQYGNNSDVSGILSNMPTFTDAQLFAEVEDLFHKTSTGDLQTVGDIMINRFRNNIGGQFTNSTLSQAVFENSNFQKFIVKFGKDLHLALAAKNWDINLVPPISISQRDRPVFNGLYNKFHGLQILLNDTEETIIELTNFTIDPATHLWTADLNITIKDHFGLDKNDALTYQNDHAGFAAWWILQHCRSYKPFETKISFKMQLKTQ